MRFPIRFFPEKTNCDFVGRRWWGFAITFVLFAITIWSLAAQGLNFGIDFTGGIVIEARTESAADLGKMRELLSVPELSSVSLQNFGTPEEVMIRLQSSGAEDQNAVVASVKKLLEGYGTPIEYRKVDYVGPQVGSELIRAGTTATLLAFAAMMLYMWLRFEWQFGVGGVMALIHDAIITVGFYSVTQLEFDLTAVAAILTIVGYSINDSVVIYDRIRENMHKYKKQAVGALINTSVNETLSRTVLTGGTTILAVTALAFLGGEVLKSFSYAMLFGILIGTYSSIFISAPILIYTGVRQEEEQKPATAGA